MREPCSKHKDNPAECPQAHGCERCGEALSSHYSASFECPTNRNQSFRPDAETLIRFPEQYPELMAKLAEESA